jgi:hypothetical protein
MKAPLLGVIVNRIKSKSVAGYGYGYGYGAYGGRPPANGRPAGSKKSVVEEAMLNGERNGAKHHTPRFVRRR